MIIARGFSRIIEARVSVHMRREALILRSSLIFADQAHLLERRSRECHAKNSHICVDLGPPVDKGVG